ncbi:MAG: phytanoyl-CoA dioxygenase family protein [Candidatus Hydrogenedentes bacterium]|nr:phytanoyl-CoA dioxygenase family protein [Candidatus Hydrogenedentota bacterium]
MIGVGRVLREEQIQAFHTDGYVVVEDVFSPDDLQPLVDDITAEVNRRAELLVQQGELSQTYAEADFERQLAKISLETDKLALSIWNGVLSSPGIFHLISHPRLVDIAEVFCGPEVIASSVYRLRPKLPNYAYGAVPWHQDSGYFEPYCDHALVITAWVPLVDATEANGCLWVIPKSHEHDVLRHRLHESGRYLEIVEADLPEGQAVACPVPKGGAMLFTNRTIHGSFENRTDIVRWSMDLRYQSAALPTNAPITRLEGDDLPSVAAGVPAACYPPEADFLVRSQKRPNEVIRTPEAFDALRRNYAPQSVTNRWGVHWAAPKAPADHS